MKNKNIENFSEVMFSVNEIINELSYIYFFLQRKKNKRPDTNSSFSFTQHKTNGNMLVGLRC